MDAQHISTFAGTISTVLFAGSTVPMLSKAWQTKDLRSYSLVQLALTNIGNLIHWLYIVALPFGPIWFLHGFHTVTTMAMLVWYVRHRHTWTAPKQSDRAVLAVGNSS